jgi:hypothetical protein
MKLKRVFFMEHLLLSIKNPSIETKKMRINYRGDFGMSHAKTNWTLNQRNENEANHVFFSPQHLGPKGLCASLSI